jgi:molybdopterin converting factor small subunit
MSVPNEENDLHGCLMKSMRLSEGDSGGRFMVRIKIFGPLKEVSTGADLFEVEADEDENLMDALRRLPEPLRGRIFEDDALSPELLVLVNGVEISCLGSPNEIRLKGAEAIHLVPVIHGG